MIENASFSIQIATAVSVVGSVIFGTYKVSGLINRVDEHEKTLKERSEPIAKIPILENMVETIKDDIADIKDDLKILIKRQ
jgi:hypothetical protein